MINEARSSEQRSDELRRRVYNISTSNADTSVCNANSATVSNARFKPSQLGDTLKAQIASLAEDVEALRADVDGFKAKVANVEDDVFTNAGAITANVGNIAALTSKVEEVEAFLPGQ